MCELEYDMSKKSAIRRRSLVEYCRRHIGTSDSYKIGITCNPKQRKYGYSGEYDKMVVIYKTDDWTSIQCIERDLIKEFSKSDNRNPGGEGNPGNPPYYLYVVTRKSRSDSGWEVDRTDGYDARQLNHYFEKKKQAMAMQMRQRFQAADGPDISQLDDETLVALYQYQRLQNRTSANDCTPCRPRRATRSTHTARESTPDLTVEQVQQIATLLEVGVRKVCEWWQKTTENSQTTESSDRQPSSTRRLSRPIWQVTNLRRGTNKSQKVQASTIPKLITWLCKTRNISLNAASIQRRGDVVYATLRNAHSVERYAITRHK